MLPKLNTVKKMLTSSSTDFHFLNESANARNRTLFYSIISRLLFNEDVLSRFQSFVAPIHQVISDHTSQLEFPDQVLEGLRQFNTAELMRANVPVNTVIGVFRDLRGMLEAATSDRHYSNHSSQNDA